MNKKNTLVCFILASIFYTAASAQKINIPEAFSQAEKQTVVMLEEVKEAKESANSDLVSPRTIMPSGELQLVTSKDWTSGFFPGVLWYLYEYTNDDKWLEQARSFTANIAREQWNAGTHDMGFKIYCSFGNGYRLTNDEDYRNVIVQSGKTLIKRYNPTVGAIRSWDHNKDKWDFPVIIDNMMNLELLFATTKLTGDSTFYKIAVEHANTTMKNHFREDYGTYHVIGYNPNTGAVEKKNTHQGHSDESTWARGEAWALYGYIMCFRETKDQAYLEQADKIAAFILGHPNMPKDLVPYWDFDAPEIPNEERDVSAAAIIASGLYELSIYSSEGKTYNKAADKIMKSLTKSYVSPVGENKGFILLHSTGSKPSNSEVDVPLSYADYYYLEALLRKQQLDEKDENNEF